jgi:hypothetical protein
LLLLCRLRCEICSLLLVVLAQCDAETGTSEVEGDARIELEATEKVDDRGNEGGKLVGRGDRLKQLVVLKEDGVILQDKLISKEIESEAIGMPSPGRTRRRET